MLPTSKEVVVIVVVASADLDIHIRGVVVIHGATLIFRIEIFYDDAFQPRGLLQLQFRTQEPVFEVVAEIAVTTLAEVGHHRVVLEELVGIESYVPCRLVEIQAHHPGAQLIALHILEAAVVGI